MARNVPTLYSAIKPAVTAAAARLAAATGAHAVVLFGSRARGDHDEDSDWDLCVVLPDDAVPARSTPGALRPLVAGLGAAIQVVPIRRSVFEAKRGGLNTLSHDVARDGVVLYGSLDGLPKAEGLSAAVPA